MKRVYDGKENCCGCSACSTVCPVHAISMSNDEKGFSYPVIDESKCINCHMCKKACAFSSMQLVEKELTCYAARHTMSKEVSTSRSGAVFSALAQNVLEQGGVVFGAAFETPSVVIHCAAFAPNEALRFKGSKYVQSEIRDCFAYCISLLKEGKTVLFSGTSCQIHGLLGLLETIHINMDKLLLVDIVCHGVPSPQVWQLFVSEIERRNRKKVVNVCFRDKGAFGWKAHKESFQFADGSFDYSNNWANAFYSHNMFRESCYNCKYTSPYHQADITLADYWGIGDNAPQFDDDKGVNLVLIHTDKGRNAFAQIQSQISYAKTDIATSMQPNLVHPSRKGEEYELFWKDYLQLPPRKFASKWLFPTKSRVFIGKCTRFLRRRIKNK